MIRHKNNYFYRKKSIIILYKHQLFEKLPHWKPEPNQNSIDTKKNEKLTKYKNPNDTFAFKLTKLKTHLTFLN